MTSANGDLLATWRVDGDPDLAGRDPASTEFAPGDKEATKKVCDDLVDELAELQERLWGEDRQSLLLVLQAMDAGGKDGTIAKVFTGVNPQGVKVTSFKQPSDEDLAHDFLWRIHPHTPARGEIAVFNRSQYEDVLVVRVNELVPESVWRPRYETIRNFEAGLVAADTTVVKLFLHISKAEQKERFQARLDDADKQWKFSTGDLEVRAKWDDYQAAYGEALAETSTADAPWYVVPADRKWYRDWVVLTILVETLRAMDPRFPDPEPGLADVVIE